MRIYNPEEPIACEAVRIYAQKQDLRFRLWYLNNNNEAELAYFDGSIIKAGALLWFIGVSTADNQRIRTLHFWDEGNADKTFGLARWGIASSDVPISGSHAPASTRVLLLREASEKKTMTAWARQRVKFLAESDLPSEDQDVILRMIKNEYPASSMPRSTLPATDADGALLSDPILKVNQNTVDQLAADIKAGKVFKPFQ